MERLRVPVQLRWSDMDAYAHVNNVEMLRLLEEARIEAFWRLPGALDGAPAPAGVATWPTAVLDAGPGAATSTLVARQEIEYLRPLGYRREPVVVDMWISHIGGASLDVGYEVLDAMPGTAADEAVDAGVTRGVDAVPSTADAGAEPYARALTTLVLVDAATGAPRRIGPAEREAWAPYIGPPPVFRRRPR